MTRSLQVCVVYHVDTVQGIYYFFVVGIGRMVFWCRDGDSSFCKLMLRSIRMYTLQHNCSKTTDQDFVSFYGTVECNPGTNRLDFKKSKEGQNRLRTKLPWRVATKLKFSLFNYPNDPNHDRSVANLDVIKTGTRRAEAEAAAAIIYIDALLRGGCYVYYIRETSSPSSVQRPTRLHDSRAVVIGSESWAVS